MPACVRVGTTCLFGLLVLVAEAGCSMSWTEGWKLDRERANAAAPDVEALRAVARAADGIADDRAGVEALVRAWKAVSRAVPDDYEALWNLASAYTLLGEAYARSIGEKGEFYRRALQSAEQAMALEPAFRAAVDGGSATWDAIETLPASRADAIGWWSTALSRMFHECLSGVVQETNRVWLEREEKALATLERLQPGWGEGFASFHRAVTLAQMPPRAGGDLAMAAVLFERAITDAPEGVRNRWGRARYLATETNDARTFRADLEWVASRDPKAAPGSHAWNTWFRRESAAVLARQTDWF